MDLLATVGKTVIIPREDTVRGPVKVFVQMAIRAPNGNTCHIFGNDVMEERPNPDRPRAIRAFMEQHRGDR